MTYEDLTENANLMARQAVVYADLKVGEQPGDVFTMEATNAITTALRGVTFAVLAVANRLDALAGRNQP